MLYIDRLTTLEQEIESIITDLNHTFYFAEPENLHRQSSEKWSAIEELEYANLKGHHFMESLRKTPPASVTPKAGEQHNIRLFARYLLKRETARPSDPKKIPAAFTPVSRRENSKYIRINEQKVFADLLALLEMWKTMLHSGERENLKMVKLRHGFLSLFTVDALEIAYISLHIIRKQVEAAKKCVGILEK
jgi:hypothetical protein